MEFRRNISELPAGTTDMSKAGRGGLVVWKDTVTMCRGNAMHCDKVRTAFAPGAGTHRFGHYGLEKAFWRINLHPESSFRLKACTRNKESKFQKEKTGRKSTEIINTCEPRMQALGNGWYQHFSKSGPQTSKFTFTWELGRNVNSWVSPQIYQIRNSEDLGSCLCFDKLPGDSDAHLSLKTTHWLYSFTHSLIFIETSFMPGPPV